MSSTSLSAESSDRPAAKINRAFDMFQRDSGKLSKLGEHFQSFLFELNSRHDIINHTQAQRFCRLDELTRKNQLAGAFVTNDPRQQHGRYWRKHPQLDLRLAKARALARNGDITSGD